MNVNPITSRKIQKYLTLGNFDSRPGNHEVSAWSFGQNGQNVQPCHRDPVQISRQMCWQEFTKGHFFPVKPKVGSYVRWYLLTAKKAQIARLLRSFFFFFLSSGDGKNIAVPPNPRDAFGGERGSDAFIWLPTNVLPGDGVWYTLYNASMQCLWEGQWI